MSLVTHSPPSDDFIELPLYEINLETVTACGLNFTPRLNEINRFGCDTL